MITSKNKIAPMKYLKRTLFSDRLRILALIKLSIL